MANFKKVFCTLNFSLCLIWVMIFPGFAGVDRGPFPVNQALPGQNLLSVGSQYSRRFVAGLHELSQLHVVVVGLFRRNCYLYQWIFTPFFRFLNLTRRVNVSFSFQPLSSLLNDASVVMI